VLLSRRSRRWSLSRRAQRNDFIRRLRVRQAEIKTLSTPDSR